VEEQALQNLWATAMRDDTAGSEEPPVENGRRERLKSRYRDLQVKYWLLNTELQTLVEQLRGLDHSDRPGAARVAGKTI
jgi:hypothetical protein